MASTTPIKIIVTGDSEDAKRALRDLDSSMGSAENRIKSFGSSLTSFGKVSALVSLGTDALALAGDLAPAVGILGILPAVAGAAAASISTLFVGLHGLGDAFKTSSAAGGAAAVNTTSYQRAIEAASRGVTEAERNLSDAQQKAKTAQDSLNQARVTAAADLASYVDKLADARLNEESASIAVQEAQQNLEKVQKGNAATALQLQQAQLQVAQAEANLQKTQSGHVATALELQKAQLKVEETTKNLEIAQKSGLTTALGLQKAQLAVADAQQNLQSLQDQGIPTALGLKQAQLQLAQSQQSLNDLQQQGKPTALDLEKAQLQVAEATQRQKEAQEGATQTQQDATEAQAKGVDGADNVVKAQKDLDLANRDVADSQQKVLLAQQQLADAQQNLADAMNKSTGAMDKQAAALAALSPNARAFVETILSLKTQWDSLKNSVQDALFANASKEVNELATVSFPTLRTGMTSVAGGFNEVAIASSQAMQTPMFQGAMATAFDGARTSLDQFAPALANLMLGLANLSTVATPFLTSFTGWLANLANRAGVFLQSAEGAERMRGVLDKAVHVLQDLWSIAKDVFNIFGNLFHAADSSNMLGVLQQITSELAKWSGSAEGQQTLQTMFQTLGEIAPSLASNLPTILGALGAIASAFNSLPQPVKSATGEIFAWSIALGPFVSGIGGAIGIIGGMSAATKELALAFKGESASAFATFIASSASAAASAIATAATVVAGWVAMAAEAVVDGAIMAAQWLIAFWPVVLVGIAVVALTVLIVENWGTIKRVTGELWNTVKSWTGEAWDWVYDKIHSVVSWIGGVGGWISRSTTGMWDGIKDAFRSALNWIIDHWNGLRFKMPSVDTHIPGVGTVGGFDLGVPAIPRFAQGGIVPARPGGTLALLAEAGRNEAVVPLPKDGSLGGLGGAHIEFHEGSIQSNANPGDIANEIAWMMKTTSKAS